MPGSRRSHCPPQSPRAKTLRTGLISCLRLACEGEAMLQRVNEGQDGTRGHLMYGSCPGLNAAEAFQRASVDVLLFVITC